MGGQYRRGTMNLVLAPAFTQKKLPNLNISVTSSSSGNRGISSLIATIASSSGNSNSCSSSRFKSRIHNHSSNHSAIILILKNVNTGWQNSAHCRVYILDMTTTLMQ